MTQHSPEAILENSLLIHSAADVQDALDQLSRQITQQLADKKPVLLCVMGGGVVFAGHLLTRLRFPLAFDYVHATRYGNQTVGKTLTWHAMPRIDLTGRTVLLVDDILDEGITLQAIQEECYALGAKEVLTSVFVDKDLNKTKPIEADFVGLTVPDAYVFGFGMDVCQLWRNLDAIYALPPEMIDGL